MQFTLSLLAVAGLVAAQGNPLNDIPECAKSCVGQFLSGSNIAGCSLLDYKCVCGNKEFINNIACCLAPVCDDKGKSDTIALANKLCKAFNVDLPTAVTCNTAAATSTGDASTGSAASASSTPAATTTSGSGSGSTTTGASSSGAQSTGSMSTGASSGAGSSSAASSTNKPGAAPTNMAGLVGAAAALAFAL